MALFERKSPYAKLVEDYHKLSPEDREKFHAEILDVKKAEDEREIDKVEAEKAESPEKEDAKREEVKEESKEIGKEINEAEETHKEEKPIEEVEELPKEEIEKERPLPADDRIDKLTELVNALAEKIDAMAERKEEPKPFGLGSKGFGESREKLGTSADERKKYFGF